LFKNKGSQWVKQLDIIVSNFNLNTLHHVKVAFVRRAMEESEVCYIAFDWCRS